MLHPLFLQYSNVYVRLNGCVTGIHVDIMNKYYLSVKKQPFSSHIYIMVYILINNLIPSFFLLVLGGSWECTQIHIDICHCA